MMKTEAQMTKENQINEAIEAFTARTRRLYGDVAYSYQAGYYETVIRGLLLRVNDEDRKLVLDQLDGSK